jgi:hypothetical protein
MAGAVLLLYLLIIILVGGIVFGITGWYRRARLRPKQAQVPAGFVRTDEIMIDPTTGVRQRVWYNEQTGERWYETLGD